MIKNNLFSCYIIGNDNITIQCAEIIVAKGHKLLGLISASDTISNWCISNGIHHFENLAEFNERLNKDPFDFLFSIINGEYLPKEILKLPRYYSINYHDSPLPKYAGLYATSHAILNNEKQHAISWHLMDECIDGGDILKQAFFQIDKKDTAFSLNLKSFEHAIHAFQLLVGELATNTCKLMKQNLTERSYFGLKDKPPDLGFILWDQPAENIDRLCRALTFGHYPNQLASPKVLLGETIFVVAGHKKLKTSSGKKPGTILHISNKAIHIATQTSDIALTKLLALNGTQSSLTSLAVTINSKLPKIESKLIKKLAQHPAMDPKIEKFWVTELLNCAQKEVSFLAKLEKATLQSVQPKSVTIPITLLNQISKAHLEYSMQDIMLTLTLVYLYRLNNYQNLSVAYNAPLVKTDESPLGSFLSQRIPFTTDFHSNMSFFEALKTVTDKKKKLAQKHTFTEDIGIRYPQLQPITDAPDINICITDAQELPYQDKKLNLSIAKDGSWFTYNHSQQLQSHIMSNTYLKNMHRHFLALLKGVAAAPHNKLYEFPIMDTKEQNTVTLEWNNTQHHYQPSKLLHQYVEDQIAKTPLATAVIMGKHSLNYISLNHKANKLAHFLTQHGIKPNDLVGICIERSLEMVVCILGILKSGGAYLPLDPNYPDNRIAYMLNDSKSPFLLIDSHSSRIEIDGYSGEIIEINSLFNDALLPEENLKPSNKSQDLAYAIYTSGTTGKPKGVAISHQAICNHMLWMQQEYRFTEKDIFLQKTPFSFDASVWEFFAPLLIGATLVMAPKDAHADPDQLIDLIKNNDITTLQVVPTMLNELIHRMHFSTCSSLRQVFSGGETLLPATIKAFFSNKPSNAELHNLYGPTETTIEVLTTTCTPQDANSSICRIGKPIFNTKAYVLDDLMQPVPIGIPGELYIGGDALAIGYLHNPTLTQQKFLPNPFSNDKRERLYKTGDLVKWLADGNIEYLGRIDNQIKIRGFRIEINEIETHLMKIKAIEQCIVAPEPNLDDSMSLSAYLVLDKNSPMVAKDIREFLQQHIPEYMIPNRYFIVDKFLLTPSGKIDRKILPIPKRQLDSGTNFTAPTNDIEKLLHNIWCLVLKVEPIGIDDDFFELGGNSLLAMKILSSIQQQFSISLSISKLFKHTSIRSLAKAIETSNHQIVEHTDFLVESCIVPLKTTGNKTPLFLVHPVGGSVFWYKLLDKYLDDDQPLYAIQDPGLDKNELLFNSLEEMAYHYIQAILTVQPQGPYIIGGASFGTTVAVEMAKQLQDQGQNVLAIMALDGWAFYPTLQNNENYFQQVMQEQNLRILKKYLENAIYNSEFLLQLQSHREQLLSKYQLPMIQSKLVLFKAKELNELFQYNAPLNWWEEHAHQPIEFHLVPGDHESMFYEPHIKILAGKLNDSLNQKHAMTIEASSVTEP